MLLFHRKQLFIRCLLLGLLSTTPLRAQEAEPEIPEGAELIEGLPIDEEAFKQDLIALDHDGESPRFVHAQFIDVRKGGEKVLVSKSIEQLPLDNLVIRLHSIQIDPLDMLRKEGGSFTLDPKSRSLLDKTETIEGHIALETEMWRTAAQYQLLWISHYAPLIDTRRSAYASLMEFMKMVDQSEHAFLGSAGFKRLFQSCDDFGECFDMLTQLGRVIEAVPREIAEPAYREKLNALFDTIIPEEKKFLADILKFRLQCLVNHAMFLSFTALHYADNRGREPKLSDEQYKRIRLGVMLVTEKNGKDNLWLKILKGLRADYNEHLKSHPLPEGQEAASDYELLVVAIAEHLEDTAKEVMGEEAYEELLPLDPGIETETSATEEVQPESEDFEVEIARAMENSLAAEVAKSLFLTHYGANALYYYLNRIKNKNPKVILEPLNIALSKKNADLFEQGQSFHPLTAFFALTIFSKYELRLPHRKAWFETTELMATRLQEYAKAHAEGKTVHGEFDFLPEAHIKARMTPVATLYSEVNKRVSALLAPTTGNLTQFRGDGQEVSPFEIETWAAKNITQFHSLYYQWQKIADVQEKFNHAILDMQEINGDIAKHKFYESQVQPVYDEYVRRSLNAACYGYWFPLDPVTGKAINSANPADFSRDSVIAAKPDWQAKYSFGKNEHGDSVNQQVYDLKVICGKTPGNVPNSVLAWMSYENTKHTTDNQLVLGLQGFFRLAGDAAMILPASIGANVFGGVIKESAGGTLKKTMRRVAARKTIVFFARLTRAVGLDFVAARSTDLAVFILVKRGIEQLLRVGTSFLPEEAKKWLPNARPFMELDRKLDDETYLDWTTRNIWMNYGQEFAMGLPLFMIIPSTTALAHRQAYYGKILPPSKLWVGYTRLPRTKSDALKIPFIRGNLARRENFAVEHYFTNRGQQIMELKNGQTFYRVNPAGYSITQEGAYVGLPILYNTAIFTSGPYGARSVSYYFFGSEDHPWQGWSVLRDETLNSAAYASLFSVFRLTLNDAEYRHRNSRFHAKQVKSQLDGKDIPVERFEYYKILGLKPLRWTVWGRRTIEPTKSEVEMAYQNAILKGAESRKATLAARTLMDPQAKAAYDAKEYNSTMRDYKGLGALFRDLELIKRYAVDRGMRPSPR